MTTTDKTAEKAREQMQAAIARFDQARSLKFADESAREVVTAGRALLAALTASPAQGEWISVPREQMRDWYTQAFAMFVAAADEDDDRPTPGLMVEMEMMLAAAPAAPSSGEWIEREAAAKCAESHAAPSGVPAIDYDQACHDIAAALRALELPSTLGSQAVEQPVSDATKRMGKTLGVPFLRKPVSGQAVEPEREVVEQVAIAMCNAAWADVGCARSITGAAPSATNWSIQMVQKSPNA